MAKTSIINVEIDSKINTAYVTYSTGTEKLYPANKLPKTVQAWLEEHQEEAKEMVEEEPEAVEEVIETVEEAVEEEPETVEGVEQAVRKLPATTQKPELTVPVEAEIVEDNSMGAAEVVGFGVMMAMTVVFWGIVGLVQILMAGIETLAYWAWSRREQAAAGCRTAAGWIGSRARAMAACLPAVTTRRGLLVAVRVLPILIGMMALM